MRIVNKKYLKILKYKPHIIIVNHPSKLDPFIILFNLPVKPAIIVNKWAYKHIKLLAWVFGYEIILNDKFSGLHCRTALKKGKSLLIFPEGDLSAKSKEIYLGYFYLSQCMNINILPIKIKKGKLLVFPSFPYSNRDLISPLLSILN